MTTTGGAANRAYVNALAITAATLGGTSAAERTQNTTYLNGLDGLNAARVTGASVADQAANRTYVNALGVTAATLGGASAAERTQNVVYLNTLDGLNAAAALRVTGASVADQAANRTYVNALGVTAATLGGASAAERTQNVAYLNALDGLNAAAALRVTGASVADQAANRTYVNALGVTAATLVGGTAAVDAANFAYIRQTLGIGRSVAPVAVTITQADGTTCRQQTALVPRNPPLTMADVALTLNSRVLLVGQTNGVDNGVYLMGDRGRAADLPAGVNAAGVTVWDAAAERLWVCVNDADAAVVGTHALTFRLATNDGDGRRAQESWNGWADIASWPFKFHSFNLVRDGVLRFDQTPPSAVAGRQFTLYVTNEIYVCESRVCTVSCIHATEYLRRPKLRPCPAKMYRRMGSFGHLGISGCHSNRFWGPACYQSSSAPLATGLCQCYFLWVCIATKRGHRAIRPPGTSPTGGQSWSTST